MRPIKPSYDAVIIGSGHNGLVAACYLAKAGLSVLVAERNSEIGGATQSEQIFEDVDARLSAYSYLVSLFPDKILRDLDLSFQLKSRKTASYTPQIKNGDLRELLVQNDNSNGNREAFIALTGSEDDYLGYLRLQELQETLASITWPSLTKPLVARAEMYDQMGIDGKEAWKALIEEPLGNVIERLISDDLIRGMVFTDARIGLSTFPQDPSLIQNRSFLYHVMGRGTGEWRVPVGGMGSLVTELIRGALGTARVDFATDAMVSHVDSSRKRSSVTIEVGGQTLETDTRFVLCNASAQILDRLLGVPPTPESPPLEGAGFKINMLLTRLPQLRSKHCNAADAFAGTFHIDESYEQMIASYHESMAGKVPSKPPGEIYCHTLTDNSILSDDLNERGFHTLTLFGLDTPYRLFEKDNERVRNEILAKYLAGINQFLREPIEECLATDGNGDPCIEAMSPVDLENKIHLPKGNIFHGDLTWPFAETDDEVGQWGVETTQPNIFLCGSAAKRGGAVSGIPGHNAAMKVLETVQ